MGSCTSKQNNESTKSQISIRTNLQSEKDQNKPIEVKVVLLGDQFVGKSSIAQRFCKNVYTGQYVVTIGGAYLQQKIVLNNGTIIKFHFWDTGGQERFRSMANLYYRDASAAVLCYDITNPKSLESLSYWIEELRHKCDQDKLVLCLAGNKSDSDPSERRITTAKAKEFAENNRISIFQETSAKMDIGIKELFHAIAKKIFEIKSNEGR